MQNNFYQRFPFFERQTSQRKPKQLQHLNTFEATTNWNTFECQSFLKQT